jgi:uncharacterized membrane protein YgcG
VGVRSKYSYVFSPLHCTVPFVLQIDIYIIYGHHTVLLLYCSTRYSKLVYICPHLSRGIFTTIIMNNQHDATGTADTFVSSMTFASSSGEFGMRTMGGGSVGSGGGCSCDAL